MLFPFLSSSVLRDPSLSSSVPQPSITHTKIPLPWYHHHQAWSPPSPSPNPKNGQSPHRILLCYLWHFRGGEVLLCTGLPFSCVILSAILSMRGLITGFICKCIRVLAGCAVAHWISFSFSFIFVISCFMRVFGQACFSFRVLLQHYWRQVMDLQSKLFTNSNQYQQQARHPSPDQHSSSILHPSFSSSSIISPFSNSHPQPTLSPSPSSLDFFPFPFPFPFPSLCLLSFPDLTRS